MRRQSMVIVTAAASRQNPEPAVGPIRKRERPEGSNQKRIDGCFEDENVQRQVSLLLLAKRSSWALVAERLFLEAVRNSLEMPTENGPTPIIQQARNRLFAFGSDSRVTSCAEVESEAELKLKLKL
jgi:hypothetical protein